MREHAVLLGGLFLIRVYLWPALFPRSVSRTLQHRKPRILRKARVHLRKLAKIEHRAAIRRYTTHVPASGTKPGNCGFPAHAPSLAAGPRLGHKRPGAAKPIFKGDGWSV